jgi:hypothetical protein
MSGMIRTFSLCVCVFILYCLFFVLSYSLTRVFVFSLLFLPIWIHFSKFSTLFSCTACFTFPPSTLLFIFWLLLGTVNGYEIERWLRNLWRVYRKVFLLRTCKLLWHMASCFFKRSLLLWQFMQMNKCLYNCFLHQLRTVVCARVTSWWYVL